MNESTSVLFPSFISRFKLFCLDFKSQLHFKSLIGVIEALVNYCDVTQDNPRVKVECLISHLRAIRHYIKIKEGKSLYLRSISASELDKLISSGESIIGAVQSVIGGDLKPPPKASIIAREDNHAREAKLAHEQICLDDNSLFHVLLRSIWLYGINNGFVSKSIFISYAWPMGEKHNEGWTKSFVEKFAFHLVSAGFQVFLDDIQGGAGFPLDVFMEKLKKCDHVLLISSRTMQEKLKKIESGVNQEKLKIIEYLEQKRSAFRERIVIPVLFNYSNYCDPLFASLAEVPMCVDGYLGSLMKLLPRLFDDSKEKFEKWFDQQLKKEQISIFEEVPQYSKKQVKRNKLLLDIELKLTSLQQRKKDHNSQGILVIQGEEGVGKTELGVAYCHSADAKHRYAKIYWIEGGISTSPDIPSGSLLVLNDVEDCQTRLQNMNLTGDIDILITTRENLFGFSHVSVPTFTFEEAREFIELMLWNKEVHNTTHIETLIKYCGVNPRKLSEAVNYINRNKLNIPRYLRLIGQTGFDGAIAEIEILEPKLKGKSKKENTHYDEQNDEQKNSEVRGLLFKPTEQMRPWRLPMRNPNFRGREKLLNILISQLTFQALDNLKPVAITACDGMGGIGKTQLAMEFAHKRRDYYRFIIWIPSESIERIQVAYLELARQLNIFPEKSSPEEIVLIVKHYFTKNPGNLLIFDDAPNYSVVESFIPKTGNAVLITSRTGDGQWPQSPLSIPVFLPKEARQYVKDMLAEAIVEQDTDIDELCEQMGFLPLALAQAVAYIWLQKINIREFLVRFKEVPDEVLRSKTMPILDKHLPVYKTFKLALDIVAQNSLFAKKLLNIFSFLHSEAIPSLLLSSEEMGECVEEALGLLSAYSLITIDSHYRFGIHRLVQEIIQLRLQSDDAVICFHSALNSCIRAFPYGVGKDTSAEITRKLAILSHLEALMGKAKSDEDLSQLLTCIQNAYEILGDEHKRQSLLEQLLVINKRYYGTSHAAVAETMMNLGVTLWDLDIKRSCLILEEALVIAIDCYGEDHPEVARVLINLGNAKGFLKNWNERLKLLEKALVINKKHYPPNHPMIAINLANLANASNCLGDHDRAYQLITESLEIEIAYYGKEHVKTAGANLILANIHGDLGNISFQKESLEEALKVYRHYYGDEHPKVASTLQILGVIQMSLGKNREAHKLFEEVLLAYEKFYGPNHPRLVSVLSNLAVTFGRLQDHQTKLKLLQQCLEIAENFYGPNHKFVATILTNLANAYGSLGDQLKQKELLEKALVLDEHLSGGKESLDVAIVLTNLGPIYTNLGQPEVCQRFLRKALTIKEKLLSIEHYEVAITAKHLGDICCDLGEFEEGITLLKRSLAFEEKYYGLDHEEVGNTLGILGAAYREIGNPKEACKLLERTLEIDEKNFGKNHPYTTSTLTNLANAYGDSGDLQKHHDILQQVLVIEKKHHGDSSPEVAMTLYNLATVFFKMNKIKVAYDFCLNAHDILSKYPESKLLSYPESKRVGKFLSTIQAHPDLKIGKSSHSNISFLDKKNPQNTQDYLQLAQRCKMEGNIPGQQSCLKQALNLVNNTLANEFEDGNKVHLYKLQAKIYIEMQNFDSAMESATIAFNINPQDEEITILIDTTRHDSEEIIKGGDLNKGYQ